MPSFWIRSPAFEPMGPIPPKYTCDGEDVSPPLDWGGIPASAKSLALIVDDPDAPDPAAPQRVWVHWVLYNLPTNAAGLLEGHANRALPRGAQSGKNDWGKATYGGPCPPVGKHRYFHKLYALDTVLEGLKSPTKADVEAAMKGHVLASAQVIGTYQRPGK
jgi:Raf kinase inhibitor-like YbhB/YbcL family protein